jgi:hypothetical protein
VSPLAWILIGPLFLISGCIYLCLLIAVACALASFTRSARLRVTLKRRGRVPGDGTPLDPGEAYLLAGIERGLKQRADEPAPNYYQNPGWPP